jgi:hypothetical protein
VPFIVRSENEFRKERGKPTLDRSGAYPKAGREEAERGGENPTASSNIERSMLLSRYITLRCLSDAGELRSVDEA